MEAFYLIHVFGPMKAIVKDDTTREILTLEFIKKKDPFMPLKMGMWGSALDLSTR